MARAPNATLRSPTIPDEPDYATDTADKHGRGPIWISASPPDLGTVAQTGVKIDMASCLHCGGPLTIIAAIEDPMVITKFLAHLGLPTQTPPPRFIKGR